MKKETDEKQILKDDGNVTYSKVLDFGDYWELGRDGAWRIFENDDCCVTIINQDESKGNRKHYHRDIDELWIVVTGKYLFEIGEKRIILSSGGFISAKKGERHRITALEDGSRRVAISKNKAEHIYED